MRVLSPYCLPDDAFINLAADGQARDGQHY